MTSATSSSTEYIQHHLVHLQYNLQTNSLGDGGFWTLHLDTIGVSLVLGFCFLIPFIYAAHQARIENPPMLQNIVEVLVSYVNDQIKENLHIEDISIGALALTIFIWVFLMNFMDLVPVDLPPQVALLFGLPYFRAVPTADVNLTLAMSVSVILLVYAYGIKFNGITGFIYELLAEPFGIFLFPVNLLKHILSDGGKAISLALRLYGNLYAGEIIFILIALTPYYLQWIFAGAWLGFHLFVITIQAFIFMMLTIVYIGLSKHEH